MPPQSPSGWVPTRGWFYALAGVVVVETTLLAGGWWKRPDLPKASAAPPLPAPSAAALAVPTPFPLPSSTEAEEQAAPATPERDPLTLALRTRPRLRRMHRFEELGASLAKRAPQEALRVLQEIPPADRLSFVRGMFDTLSRSNRRAAVAVAGEIADGRERGTALLLLLTAWEQGIADNAAIQEIRDLRPRSDAALGMRLLETDPVDPELVVQWARLLTDGTDRVALLGGLAGRLAWADPARALAYGDGLADKEKEVFETQFLRFLRQDQIVAHPQQALAWSQTLSDPALRDAIGNQVFASWIEQNANAASLAFASLPPGQMRENALRLIATKLANENTDAADAFALSLTGRERNVVSAVIEETTPVGIGVRLTQDEAGYPVVNTVMEKLPAALSGQFHPGDRIVGIVGPDGELVDTSGLDLAAIINMVRGTPNSAVQLQVTQPQSGGGFSLPTTVTLYRQRMKHG